MVIGRGMITGVAVLLLALLAAACGGSSPTPTPTPSPVSDAAPDAALPGGPLEVGDAAPDFQGIDAWLNSEPLSMGELQGKVVLVDFWTYTCVNCIRTFPFLRDWHEKYADKGLVIVGVHRPEFTFEEERANVVRALETHGLEYPVAQDNASVTWDAYDNRFWPAKYLIDADGVLQYTHFGEGAYDKTEEKIRELLEEAGADLSDVSGDTAPGPIVDPESITFDVETQQTRELYGGVQRNYNPAGLYVAQVPYYDGPELVQEYTDPGVHRNHYIYLQGSWRSGLESLIHARETQDFEDYIAIMFYARSVNVVIQPQVEEPFEVRVTIDGRALEPEEAGADVVFRDGRSVLVVDEPRLYQVVELPAFGGHDLKLSSNSEGFAFFAFTFGTYLEGL